MQAGQSNTEEVYMRKRVIAQPEYTVTIGEIFGTPLVVKGKTWLPFAQLITWPIMAWVAKKRLPERSWWESLGIGFFTMPVILGSEWGHNLAHAAAARWVGKPMDAIRIIGGMPRVIYEDINDLTVTPRQHILRALGGPLFNLLILPVAILFRTFTRPKSTARDIADTAVMMNVFIPLAGLQPIPGLDGGPILKWTLVESGCSIEEADLVVRKVDGALGVIYALTGGMAFKVRRWIIGTLLVQYAAIAFSIALGIFHEQKS